MIQKNNIYSSNRDIVSLQEVAHFLMGFVFNCTTIKDLKLSIEPGKIVLSLPYDRLQILAEELKRYGAKHINKPGYEQKLTLLIELQQFLNRNVLPVVRTPAAALLMRR